MAEATQSADGKKRIRFLSESERRILAQVADAAFPPGRVLPSPDGLVIEKIENFIGRLGPAGQAFYRTLLWGIEVGAVPLKGRPFSRISSRDERESVLDSLYSNPATFWSLRGLMAPMKISYLNDRRIFESMGCKFGVELPSHPEKNRWDSQIVSLSSQETEHETIEVDAVVVGTGAGGAPVANALAAKGHAVLMLEEGRHYTRMDFNGHSMEMQRKMYRQQGATVSIGNAMIPIPVGATLGGSTTINSGTCYRVPERVLAKWRSQFGLSEFTPDSMDPYYSRVEKMIGVAEADWKYLGGVARVIARGSETLGYHHRPLRRNAPECDGQGLCCFGCPTDAKRSTNVSYVPEALKAGAMAYTEARVDEILVENGRATGVIAHGKNRDGKRVQLTVRAKVVVLSCGTLYTPLVLMKNKLANSSGMVGKNLAIHPASMSWALFDESIEGWNGIPQGYAIEEFEDEGIRFEGGFTPLDLGGAAVSFVGKKWRDLIDNYDRLACFGFMIEDESRGRVRPGPGGMPFITYWLNREDVRKMIRAQAILARVYLAAGARGVYPGLQIFDDLSTEAKIRRLEEEGPSRLSARHFDLSAYHPLGTCIMGNDPKTSVVRPTHETHDVRNLYICDGSSVPSSLGVNPQLTIMAMAERASEYIDERIRLGEQGREAA